MTGESVLDAWAILAWLLGEQPAAARVESVVDEGAITTWVNLGEVAYIIERRYDASTADRLVDEVRTRLASVLDAGRGLTLAAARIKARGGLSYADAYAAAAALRADATLLTGDPELLADGRQWRAEDLRAATS